MKKNLMLACLLTLGNLTLLAQTGKSPRFVHTKEKSAIHVPSQEAPMGLKKIFGNLGKPTNAYNDTSGWSVSGPNSITNFAEFIALPFTPKSNAHVSQIRVAVVYGGFGANQVNVSLYGDANGAPGTLLAGPATITNLPSNGTCCVVSDATLPPVAVTAGSQYWIVVDTPLSGTGSDFFGIWDGVVKPVFPMAINSGNFGWFDLNGNITPAGAVFGTIP